MGTVVSRFVPLYWFLQFLKVLCVSHPKKAVLDKPLVEMRAADNYILILAKFYLFLNQVSLNLLSPVAKPSRHNVLVKSENFIWLQLGLVQVCFQNADFPCRKQQSNILKLLNAEILFQKFLFYEQFFARLLYLL